MIRALVANVSDYSHYFSTQEEYSATPDYSKEIGRPTEKELLNRDK